MGYNHYVGWIEKRKIPKILKKVDKLKKKKVRDYDIAWYLIKKIDVKESKEIGKLYLNELKPLGAVLYTNKKEDYSAKGGPEFFFIDNDNKLFFKKLAYTCQEIWINYLKKCDNFFQKITCQEELKDYNEKLIQDEKKTFMNIKNSTKIVIDDFKMTNQEEYRYKSNPFYLSQSNYSAKTIWEHYENFDVGTIWKHYENFDYDQYELCVFAY